MEAPHVQLILDRREVPPPLQAALQRVNARVSVRSLGKALSSGVSPTADVCVILPGCDEPPDVLDQILTDASKQACGAMVIPPVGALAPERNAALAPSFGNLNAEELTGRIKALCEIRHPLRRMREELDQLRRQHAELASDARRREEQIRLASQVQSDLLPDPLPDSEPLSIHTLYIPADCISGDIYDIQQLDDEHFSFSIADATGHGLPAALLTLLTKNSFRGRESLGEASRIIPPDELLRRINEELVSSGLSQAQFISGLHAVFHRATGRIQWARGGSPYPLLLRPGDYPRQIRSAGGLLGADAQQDFEMAELGLEPGDTLLLYTDGLETLLVGRHCDPAAMLSCSWLDRVATDGPEAALADLKKRAESGRAGTRDDITVLALRMN